MKLAKKAVLAASVLALAVGSAWAADADKPMDGKNSDGKLSKKEAANASRSDTSGFAKLDKNKDGYISKAEAKGEAELATNFDKWDMNNDGKINRAEYLAAMAKEDTGKVVGKVKDKVSGNKESSSAGSTTSAK
jgi:Ca2+-binding EF-hand superfamily protein